MPTIKDLFKDQNIDLYGLGGKLIIESRGLINPPRGAALLTSSPDALADLIGNQVGGALKGSANRPSDTIFKSDKWTAKPVTLGKTQVGVKDAVEKDTDYFVKQSPAPASIIAKLKQGGSSPAGLASTAAVSAINKFGSKNALKKLRESLKKKGPGDAYGTKYQKIDLNGQKLIESKTFSLTNKNNKAYYQTYKQVINPVTGRIENEADKIIERPSDFKKFDTINEDILTILGASDQNEVFEIDSFIQNNKKAQIPYVLIQKYGETVDPILLPGTISGISEENSPEWSNFKYVGSPFNNYRYMGVEKSLQFELKMYYLDAFSKSSMKKSLDKLRGLVYPDENISVSEYPGNGGYSPMNFNGNLIYLTINGLYDNLFGFIESLTISIDDSIPWATTDTSIDYFGGGSEIKPYPTVVNVSIGMKIINNPIVENNKYIFNHTSTPLPNMSNLISSDPNPNI